MSKPRKCIVVRVQYHARDGHIPYPNMLHDTNTDELLSDYEIIQGLLNDAKIEDGDEIQITVSKTGRRPFGDRKYRYVEIKFDCKECGAEKAIITMQHKPGCKTGKWAAASQRSISYVMTDPGRLCGGCGFLPQDCTCTARAPRD